MTKLYRYVGPPQILEQAGHQTPGVRIQSVKDLVTWVQEAGPARGGEVTATFVVDEAGDLRLADRWAGGLLLAFRSARGRALIRGASPGQQSSS